MISASIDNLTGRFKKLPLMVRLVIILCLLLFGLSLFTPHGPLGFLLEGFSNSNNFNKQLATKIGTTPEFEDATLDAGLIFSHMQGDTYLTGLDEVVGSGACAIDYNNDGWIDLFIVNGSGQTRYYGKKHWWQKKAGNALYKNLGNGRFKEVTAEAGLTNQSWGMGCVSADLDNDGDTDLLVTNKGLNNLYRNNNDGTFTDITLTSGINGNSWSTSAAIADFDGDGLLDIYIANYLKYIKGAHTFESNKQFSDSLSPAFDSTLYDAELNRLYRNLGNLKFEDVTETANVGNKGGRSLGTVWLDVNNDSRPDLLVINDKNSTPNTLYINNDGKHFTESEMLIGIGTSQGHMGISAGDIDNDGDIDLAIGSDNKHPHLLLVNNSKSNQIIENNTIQTGLFSDRGRSLGIGSEESTGFNGWSPGLHDFNNDGWLDLFMANGLATPDPDVKKIPLGQAKQLWINQGSGHFKDVSKLAGKALRDTQSARGAVFADFDNDGDIDVYVTHNNDLGQLLLNKSKPSHWLGLILEGTTSNRDAIGTTITLQTKKGNMYRTLYSQGGFLSDNGHRIHFGLGLDNQILALKIKWPDGKETTYKDITMDHYVTINQGSSKILSSPQIPASKPEISNTLELTQLKIPSNRIQYINWITNINGINTSVDLLASAVQDSSPDVRAAAVKLFSEYSHPESLKYITHTLSDDSPDVRLAAVSALQTLEIEDSIRWLLRSFDDPDARVRKRTADTFAFFFQEEEAVEFRKYLSLPYLIHQLQDENPVARVAAATALGNSEHYRAVEPLISLLHDKDINVRSHAINALGLIRERSAIPSLLSIYNETDQPPQVISQVLIALTRLNYEKIDRLIADVLVRNPLKYPSSFKTYISILNDETDGVVVNRETLFSQLNNWFNKYRSTAQKDNILLFIDALKASKNTKSIPLLRRLREHKDYEVRLAAYSFLISIDTINSHNYIQTALLDSSTKVTFNILNYAAKTDISLPTPLLKKFSAYKETRIAAIKLLGRHSDGETLNFLYSHALSPDSSADETITALVALAELQTPKIKLPENITNHANDNIRAAAFYYWIQKNKNESTQSYFKNGIIRALSDKSTKIQQHAIDYLFSSSQLWALRAIKSALSNTRHASSRNLILDQLYITKSNWAIPALIKIVKSKYDPLRINALRVLIHINNKSSDPTMKQILLSNEESEDIKFLAARALLSPETRITAEMLKTGLLKNISIANNKI